MAETSAKKEAQQRVDRIHAFRRELAELEQERALELSPEQQSRLNQHLDATLSDLAVRFDVDVSSSQKQISLAMRIASSLGGLALCVAVYLFFYRYWGMLGTSVQLAIIIATPVLLLPAIQWSSRREKTLYYTSLLVLVALGAFVMNLGVLGSIFNIAPTPGAFFAWGGLALILAYGYRLRLPLAGGLVAWVIFTAAVIVTLAGGYWDALLERPESFLPGGIALLAIPWWLRHRDRPDFPAVYRMFGLLTIFLALLVLANEGQMSFLSWPRKTAAGIYQAVGFAAAVAAVWAGLRQRYAETVNLGAGFFAIFLFNRLWVWWWDWMPKYLFFLMIGIIALALLAVFRRLRAGAGKAVAA